MSLLEIDKRVQFILEAKRDEKRFFLRDLASVLFYSTSYGYASVKSKKNNLESTYHKIINTLLSFDDFDKSPSTPEDALGALFK